jgi:hypothetical protein
VPLADAALVRPSARLPSCPVTGYHGSCPHEHPDLVEPGAWAGLWRDDRETAGQDCDTHFLHYGIGHWERVQARTSADAGRAGWAP